MVESICEGVLVEGCGQKKMKGGRSGPIMISDKTKRYKSDSNIMKGSNGIHETVETRSLRSKEEEKQEIQTPRNVTYLSFGRRAANVSTRDNRTPPIS